MKGWGALARWAPFFDDQGNLPAGWSPTPTGLMIPTPAGAGDAGKVVTVNAGGTGYQLNAAGGGVTSFNTGTGAIAQANGYGITGANANPPTPAVGLTSASSFIGVNVALAAATPANITSLALVAGTWLVMGYATFQPTAAAATVEFEAWLTATTAGAGSTAVGGGAAEWNSATTASPFLNARFAAIVAPGATTTYFLVGESNVAGAVATSGNFVTPHVVSGLVAVRLA